MRQTELVDRVKAYDPDADEALLNRAYVYAMKAHGKQFRASGDPYFAHPLEVAAILTDLKLDEATIVTALLHDTIEDTPTTHTELEEKFGRAVADLVAEVTDDKREPKAVRKQKQIDHAAHLSTGARLVKLADKICNLRDVANSPPADWPIERRREYFEWARAVVERIPEKHPKLAALFDEAYAAKPEA